MKRNLVFLITTLVLTAGTALASSPPVGAKPKVEKLFEEKSVKVVRVTLAPGATLAEHTTPVHATVAAMSGEGRVTIGGKATPLPLHGAVFLPKKIPHAVINTGKAPLVLIVHHLLTTK